MKLRISTAWAFPLLAIAAMSLATACAADAGQDGATPIMDHTLGEAGGLIHYLEGPLETLASVIDLIGIAIILWGFGRALIDFVSAELKRFRDPDNLICMQHVRLVLGTYILVGIEFMIASDIIQTVVKRELSDLAFVSALVAIRTAIGYFLGRELAEVRGDSDASA
jgi:uncharacterized membrane protein